MQRYLSFVSSLVNSNKKCLAKLAQKSLNDCGSITKQNIELIEKESGLSDVLNIHPRAVISKITFSETPETELWRIPLLKELIDIKNKKLTLPADFLNEDQVNGLINLVASS